MSSSSQEFGFSALSRFAARGIWDSFYWAPWQERAGPSLLESYDAERGLMERAGLVRSCIHLHVGAGTARPEFEDRIRGNPAEIRSLLGQRSDRLLGIARLNGDDVPRALDIIEQWIARGPMVGVCFVAGKLSCDHPNYDPLVRRLAELGALIVQLNWYNILQGEGPGVSTPAKLAVLAARHPGVTFISGHAGGEWEKGIRAVRAQPNILVETSGFDPTTGFVDMAVKELGAHRVVFGSHLPGRGLGTEFAKVLGAAISDADKELIFCDNLRHQLGPILRRKGLPG